MINMSLGFPHSKLNSDEKLTFGIASTEKMEQTFHASFRRIDP
jgi:hypothetical protein